MNKLAQEVANITHKSVLLKESIEYLRPIEDGVYIDATLGLGSHTRHLFESTNLSSRIIGFDVDEEAISIARERLSEYKDNIHFMNKNFHEIDCISSELNLTEVDGIIADLGMSSYQLEHSGRGFSFMKNEPLDMRMDAKLQFTAYDLVNEMSFEELSNLFRDYGEESFSKKNRKINNKIQGAKTTSDFKGACGPDIKFNTEKVSSEKNPSCNQNIPGT